MFDELAPVVATRQADAVLEAPADLCLASDASPSPPTPEELRTLDAVFTADAVQADAARIVGLQASVLLLHDRTRDAVDRRQQDDEEEERREDEERRRKLAIQE